MSNGQAPKNMPWADIGLVAFVFSVLLWMVLPLRPWMLDLLLAVSISSGLLVMLVIIYVREPSEFTAFPTLLLIITLFRLGINVASTRLILGEAQAGQIIQKFGEVVVQKDLAETFRRQDERRAQRNKRDRAKTPAVAEKNAYPV